MWLKQILTKEMTIFLNDRISYDDVEKVIPKL